MLKTLNPVRREISIGAVARLCGLTPRAVRLYEDRGLVSTRRTDRGVRLYSGEEVERLEFIGLARRAGLSIRDIGILVRLEERQGKAARQERMLSLCRARMKELEAQQMEVAAILMQLDDIATADIKAAPAAARAFHASPELA